jgi:hypothetical protein
MSEMVKYLKETVNSMIESRTTLQNLDPKGFDFEKLKLEAMKTFSSAKRHHLSVQNGGMRSMPAAIIVWLAFEGEATN